MGIPLQTGDYIAYHDKVGYTIVLDPHGTYTVYQDEVLWQTFTADEVDMDGWESFDDIDVATQWIAVNTFE
jgi:hypothetical protein